MIEKIRVTNRSMPESKLGGMDSGNVFGGRISAQEWARRGSERDAGMGTAQSGCGDAPGRTAHGYVTRTEVRGVHGSLRRR